MIHLSKLLADFVFNLKYENLSSDVIETTKKYILDYYAASFAGIKVNETFNSAVTQVIFDLGGKNECDVLFSDKKLPSPNAAFVNACFAHGADMDDGNRKAMGHIGAHVISTALTLAQILPVSGEDLITVINAGYDVYNRIAAAVQPGLVHRGFHSTGTVGAIACGAVAAKLMGMGRDGIYNTMALCAVQASGLIIIAESGQSCKPINPANAARTGIFSAMIISKGVKSSDYFLESKKGFLHAMSDEIDDSMITDGLGKNFTICESYMKPYPSCRHTHCGIECAVEIRKMLPEKLSVKKIKLYIYRNAIEIAGQIKVPKTADDAKFSVHYSLAVALMRGHFNLNDLDISTIDDELLKIIDCIELVETPEMEDRKAGIRGSKVVLEASDGSVYEKTVLIPLGDAAKMFSWEDLKEKLCACSSDLLTDAQCNILTANIHNFDKIKSFSTINLYKEKI